MNQIQHDEDQFKPNYEEKEEITEEELEKFKLLERNFNEISKDNMANDCSGSMNFCKSE